MPTMKEKIAKYEQFLHMLQLNAEVAMDMKNTQRLIARACDWSYAHRRGNGELSDKQQQKIINTAFNKLTDIVPKENNSNEII